MIASVHGKISHIDLKYIVLEANNIGYKIFMSTDSLETIQIGKELTVLTHLIVRENIMDLYGFLTERERSFFELLISVSGIGPKGAMNILSTVSIDTLVNAIKTGSVALLTKVSGIGKKTADKIALELRDKIDSLVDKDSNTNLSSDMDAIEALKMLGYSAEEARESLKKIDKNIADTGDKVKAALKVLN